MNFPHMTIVDDANTDLVSRIVTQENLMSGHTDFGTKLLEVRELALFAPWWLR